MKEVLTLVGLIVIVIALVGAAIWCVTLHPVDGQAQAPENAVARQLQELPPGVVRWMPASCLEIDYDRYMWVHAGVTHLEMNRPTDPKSDGWFPEGWCRITRTNEGIDVERLSPERSWIRQNLNKSDGWLPVLSVRYAEHE